MVMRKAGETEEDYKIRMLKVAIMGGHAKKGSKHKSTIDREKQLEEFKNFVASRNRTLLAAQMIIATGSIYVYRIDTEITGAGTKNEKHFKKRPVIVTNQHEILNALDYEYAQGKSPNNEKTYYFVTTKDPENRAIDSLLDRTFGKAKESVALEHSGIIGLADLLGKGALDNGVRSIKN